MKRNERLLASLAAALATTVAALSLGSGCNALTGVDDLKLDAGGGTSGTGGAATTTGNSGGQGGTGGHAGGGGAGGAGGAPVDPCAGVTCSGHGSCAAPAGQPVCTCEGGYHAVGTSCVIDETCAGKGCGNCASCEVKGGIATCTCPQDYVLQGNDCKLATDPCATANCQPDEACVPEAHCQPLGACVPTCDCSNCPNCSPDNGDGKWNDQQEYCGAAIDTSPATMACAKPCPQGLGCIPYNPQICWPLEGCFSL